VRRDIVRTMILTYHEGACVRAQVGDTTVVFSPVSKQSKNFRQTNFGADVAFISLNHPDMNGEDEASRGEKKAFVISGPGEYEVSAKGGSASGGKESDAVRVAGFRTASRYGGEEKINTVYALTLDGLSMLYLGALNAALPPDVLEMDAPDILFVPIGGNGVLGPAEAQKLAVALEAKIVIPILYDDKTLKQFLKEAGEEKVQPVDKFTVKLRDMVGKEGDVVVLSP